MLNRAKFSLQLKVIAALLIGCATISGCSLLADKPWIESQTVMRSKDDPELAKTTKIARQTLPIFLKIYEKNNKDKNTTFQIKFPVSDGSKTEFFWLDVKGVDNDKFTGTYNSDGDDFPAIKLGDSTTVPKDKVVDWIISNEDEAFGGYSIMLLLSDAIASANHIDKSDKTREADTKLQLKHHWQKMFDEAKAGKPVHATKEDALTMQYLTRLEHLYRGNVGKQPTPEEMAIHSGLDAELIKIIWHFSDSAAAGKGEK